MSDSREKRSFVCQDCCIPFKRRVFVKRDGTLEFPRHGRSCNTCNAIEHARGKREYYQMQIVKLTTLRADRIKRHIAKTKAALVTVGLVSSMLLLFASCANAHESHCPPCDVAVDGSSATTCPAPCGDDAGAADAGFSAPVDAGTDAENPDAYEPPAVERADVCALIEADSTRLGCGIACPSSWTATTCTGPNPGWCVNDLMTQVANCANLTILVQAGGECDLACGS